MKRTLLLLALSAAPLSVVLAQTGETIPTTTYFVLGLCVTFGLCVAPLLFAAKLGGVSSQKTCSTQHGAFCPRCKYYQTSGACPLANLSKNYNKPCNRFGWATTEA